MGVGVCEGSQPGAGSRPGNQADAGGAAAWRLKDLGWTLAGLSRVPFSPFLCLSDAVNPPACRARSGVTGREQMSRPLWGFWEPAEAGLGFRAKTRVPPPSHP